MFKVLSESWKKWTAEQGQQQYSTPGIHLLFGESEFHVMMNRGAGDGVILLLWIYCCVHEERVVKDNALLSQLSEEGLEEASDNVRSEADLGVGIQLSSLQMDSPAFL